MAAPTPTARATPGGIPLKDGHSTKITLASDTDISFWEKQVQPPGIDGGDPVERTTMHNTSWRTFGPRSLKTLTEAQVTAEYDPDVYSQIVAIVNVETTVTVTFKDGSTVAFYGYLRSFEPQEVEEGEPPMCEIVIQPTNWDPANNEEAGPAVASVGSV